MSAVDAFLWTVTVLLWMVGAVLAVAIAITVYDAVEARWTARRMLRRARASDGDPSKVVRLARGGDGAIVLQPVNDSKEPA